MLLCPVECAGCKYHFHAEYIVTIHFPSRHISLAVELVDRGIGRELFLVNRRLGERKNLSRLDSEDCETSPILAAPIASGPGI